MPELLWNALAIIGLLCVICTLLLGVWLSVVGRREGVPLPDEEPTLNVQNGIGDSRPIFTGEDRTLQVDSANDRVQDEIYGTLKAAFRSGLDSRCEVMSAGRGVTLYCHQPRGHQEAHDFYRCVGDLPQCTICPQEPSPSHVTEAIDQRLIAMREGRFG